MELPDSSPSSMFFGDGSEYCNVVYKIKAKLERPGMFHFDKKRKLEFNVVAQSQVPEKMEPFICRPLIEIKNQQQL